MGVTLTTNGLAISDAVNFVVDHATLPADLTTIIATEPAAFNTGFPESFDAEG